MKKLRNFTTVCSFIDFLSTSAIMDVLVDAGFLCTKAAMLNAAIKARPCRMNHDQYPFIHKW
jgi:hypothetical protein